MMSRIVRIPGSSRLIAALRTTWHALQTNGQSFGPSDDSGSSVPTAPQAPAIGSALSHRVSTANSKILLDVPSTKPALGFPDYARTLAAIIQQSEPRFAIGVFGGWGSGKTTLLQAIKTNLHADQVITVDFCAWRYEKEEHLIVPLLDNLREALVEWASHRRAGWEDAVDTARTVGKAATAILAGLSLKVGLPHAIQLSLDANKALTFVKGQDWKRDTAFVPRSFYHASFRGMQDAFDKLLGTGGHRRIVVFVDDLDRCLPAGAIEVMESMKLFFDLPGFIFVVALDSRVIEWCIDSRYSRERGSEPATGSEFEIRGVDYLHKIFQVPFTLPPVPIGRIDEFLNSMVHDNDLSQQQAGDLRSRVAAHLQFLASGIGVNPRQLKRYINAYNLQMEVDPTLDRDVVLALNTIAFRLDWKKVHGALLAERELFTQALGRQLESETSALEDLDPEYASLPADFVNYVTAGGPGNALLRESDITRYLYSAQAIRSTQSAVLLELIHHTARLRSILKEVRATAPARDILSDQQELLASLNYISDHLRTIASGSLGSTSLQQVERLRRKIAELSSLPPPFEPDEIASWTKEVSQLIGEARKGMMDVYGRGDLGAGQPAT
jgi:hypothetical protein